MKITEKGIVGVVGLLVILATAIMLHTAYALWAIVLLVYLLDSFD